MLYIISCFIIENIDSLIFYPLLGINKLNKLKNYLFFNSSTISI